MDYEEGLSLEAMRRICRKAGAERVGKSAAQELAKILEKVGVELAKEAVDHTFYAGRRTVRAKDVKAAYKKFKTERKLRI